MKKKLFITILFILTLSCTGGYFYINRIISTGFNINETAYIEIDDRKDYENILIQIKEKAQVENISSFEKVSSFLKYPDNIRTGRYAIRSDMNVLQAVRLLKSGNQTPIKLTFNNVRTKEDLSKKLASQLMLSENEILTSLNDESKQKEVGFTNETILCMFIPNTYEVYWNTSIDRLLQRMKSEYTSFWNMNRQEKAQKIALSPIEVSILASIVEEECFFSDEYPIVAGLYINRLNRKQMLQADPTVKFALGDFTLRRILTRHLETDSPYNTYKHTGLPPGPIRIPSIKGIDSVLNYTQHNFYYMCAKEDFSGRHNFANTHVEHQRNASKYQAALNKRRIYQ